MSRFVSLRRFVLHNASTSSGDGGRPDQIEAHASQQRPAIGFRRRLQPSVLEAPRG